MLAMRRAIATPWPHRARALRPTADSAHAVATTNMRTAAQDPMARKAVWASGLSRQMTANPLSGKSSARHVMLAMMAPNQKKPISVINYNLQIFFGRNVLLCFAIIPAAVRIHVGAYRRPRRRVAF